MAGVQWRCGYGELDRRQETTVMLSFILEWFANRRDRSEHSRQVLSSYASHDLRSPMTTIREAVALLADGVPGTINDKQRRLLAIILERTETWLRLVDEVVVLPQWVLNGGLLHVREESLPDVACESVERTKGLALVRGITVTMEVSDALPKIVVDRLRLGQALTILLAAVISSTEQGGHVRLSLKRMTDSEVHVEVSSENAAKSIEEGPALTAVRAVVEAHGGRLLTNIAAAVDSVCGFTLPLRAGAAAKELSHVESAHH